LLAAINVTPPKQPKSNKEDPNSYYSYVHVYKTDSGLASVITDLKHLSSVKIPSKDDFVKLSNLLGVLYTEPFCPIKLIDLSVEIRGLFGSNQIVRKGFLKKLDELFTRRLREISIEEPRLINTQFMDDYNVDALSLCETYDDFDKKKFTHTQLLKMKTLELNYDILSTPKVKILYSTFNTGDPNQAKLDIYYKTLINKYFIQVELLLPNKPTKLIKSLISDTLSDLNLGDLDKNRFHLSFLRTYSRVPAPSHVNVVEYGNCSHSYLALGVNKKSDKITSRIVHESFELTLKFLDSLLVDTDKSEIVRLIVLFEIDLSKT
jgi:hypothetical protein